MWQWASLWKDKSQCSHFSVACRTTVIFSKLASLRPGGDAGKDVPRCPSAMSALSLPLVAALGKTSMQGMCVSRSVLSWTLQPYGLKPARFLWPWDSPGENTGVGSHSLLQGISRDWTRVSCIADDVFTIGATREAPRILESVAISFSKGSLQPRDWTEVSCTAGGFFTIWTTKEAQSRILLFIFPIYNSLHLPSPPLSHITPPWQPQVCSLCSIFNHLTFFFFFFLSHSRWDLSFPTRDRTQATWMEAWSFNQWPARQPLTTWL